MDHEISSNIGTVHANVPGANKAKGKGTNVTTAIKCGRETGGKHGTESIPNKPEMKAHERMSLLPGVLVGVHVFLVGLFLFLKCMRYRPETERQFSSIKTWGVDRA